MAETEIHYVVPDAPMHQKDYETILASIGKYQGEMNRDFPDASYVPHTAEIQQEKDDVVQITFRRDLRDMTAHDIADLMGRQNAREEIRADIERHFPEDDRARLSKYYSDIPKTS